MPLSGSLLPTPTASTYTIGNRCRPSVEDGGGLDFDKDVGFEEVVDPDQ